MYESFAAELGQVLLQARHRAGLCRDEVAGALHLPVSVYARMERGKLLPSVAVLRDVCLTLGVSAEEVLQLAAPRRAPLDAPARDVLGLFHELLTRARGMTAGQLQSLLAELSAMPGA